MARKPLVLDTNGYYGQIPDTDSLIVLSASFIGNAILIPAANGAVQIGATGNARGTYSVDLQQSRTGVAMVASGGYSVILGGSDNTVNTAIGYSLVCGGYNNTAYDNYATVWGGNTNVVLPGSSLYNSSTLGGGSQNEITGGACFIAGGFDNTAKLAAGVRHGMIGGGRQNDIASADYHTISGGYLNTIPVNCGTYNTITGGYSNTQVAATSYNNGNVLGGYDNSIQGQYCVVAGGYSNDITLADGVYYSVIGGGRENNLNRLHSVIAGGYQNAMLTETDYSVIGGGRQNASDCHYSVIGGGYLNTNPANCGDPNTITGGYSNTLVAASTYNYGNVLGGYDNSIQGRYGVVAGGYSNDIVLAAGSRYSNIGGGYANDITGSSLVGTIVGGYSNSLVGSYDYVGGGKDNHLSCTGGYVTVCGGKDNTVTANYRHSSLGGLGNTISSYNNNSLGGSYNTGRYTWSTLLGSCADTDHGGQFSQASGQFNSVGDAQTMVLLASLKTTDATATRMYCRPLTATYMDIVEGTAWYYTIKLIARQTNGDYTVNGWRAEGLVHHSIGGDPTIANNSYAISFANDAAWVFAVAVNTTQLLITVTGKAGENITWVARVEMVQVID